MTIPASDPLRPPQDLEERVVSRLRETGLLRSDTKAKETSMRTIHLRWATAAAVLVALAVWAGTLVPQAGEPAAGEAIADTRPQFALMLYEDAGYQSPAPDEMETRVAEYSAWARELAKQGYLVDGAKLSERGVLLHRDRPRDEALPVSAEGMLAGYFMIRAASLAEAERIAADCPHLAYGGTVSIRPIDA